MSVIFFGCNAQSHENIRTDGSLKITEKTIAEKISKSLPPNSTFTAADGYVWYGKDNNKTNGKPVIKGVQQTSAAQPNNTNKGGFVTIKNGKPVAKKIMSYNSTTGVTTKGKNKKID